MAWETRGNSRYYYQKERVGDKVKSSYIGNGEVARIIAACEKGRRREKKIEVECQRRQKLETEIFDEKLNELSEINQSLVDALFLLNGFHQHKRQWRKKRK